MASIWERDGKMPAYPAIDADRRTETLVIGGGMTGLLCGHFLREQNGEYLILEKDRIAGGVTKNTTAKLTWQHGMIYTKLRRAFGTEGAAAYLAAGTQALDAYGRIVRERDIACGYEKKNNFVYGLTSVEKADLIEEAETIRCLGGRAVYTERAEIPLRITGAVKTFDQASFHPLLFLSELAVGLNVCEHSAVTGVERAGNGYRVQVRTADGRRFQVRAERIIAASHFPLLQPWGMYFMKLYQQRSYVLALKGTGLPPLKGMYIGAAQGSLSFRGWRDTLILGGFGGRTGRSGGGYDALRAQASKLFPACQVEAAWAAQDCMSLDGVPYIGPYSRHLPGVFVASGYNKWGMTGAMAAALALTGQMDREIAKVFRPDRTMLRRQLFVNGFTSAKNLLTPGTPRCTHMGCALKWNRQEHSWDCPCHGSRFERDGAVINDPAQSPLYEKAKETRDETDQTKA